MNAGNWGKVFVFEYYFLHLKNIMVHELSLEKPVLFREPGDAVRHAAA